MCEKVVGQSMGWGTRASFMENIGRTKYGLGH